MTNYFQRMLAIVEHQNVKFKILYDIRYNCKTHERHYDAKDSCRSSSIATRTSKTLYNKWRTSIGTTYYKIKNWKRGLIWHWLLFLDSGNSIKLWWCFRNLSHVLSKNEVVVGVNGIFVTPIAVSWFCLPWICLRIKIKWSYITWFSSAFIASEVSMSWVVAPRATCEGFFWKRVMGFRASPNIKWKRNWEGCFRATNIVFPRPLGGCSSSTSIQITCHAP